MNEQPEIEATLAQRWGASLIRGCEHAGARVARLGDDTSWCGRCAWPRRSELNGDCFRCGAAVDVGDRLIHFVPAVVLDGELVAVEVTMLIAVCKRCRADLHEEGHLATEGR